MRTILISAYACEPLQGSEQCVGWNMVLQMAKNNKVHVITRANNREVIEKNIHSKYADNLTFHYYDTGSFIRKFKNQSKGLYFYYLCWQIGIISLAHRIENDIKFDYLIHLTFGNVWLPTFLPLIKGKFIWGSLGGGEGVPSSFLSSLPIKQRLVQWLRKILIASVYINPMILFCGSRSSAILCRTSCTQNILPFWLKRKTKILEDGAVEDEVFEFRKSYQEDNNSGDEDVVIITTSKLVPYKNIISVVRALPYIPKEYKYKLKIVGSGMDKKRISEFVNRFKLSERVEMVENIPRSEIFKTLEKSTIYISSSLRDACNLALLEAMTVGLPIICLNWSGMAISTDDSCAIRLPVTNPEQMPKDMADAIVKLIENPELRKQMGMAGRERIRSHFNWNNKGRFMETLFQELEQKNRY